MGAPATIEESRRLNYRRPQPWEQPSLGIRLPDELEDDRILQRE